MTADDRTSPSPGYRPNVSLIVRFLLGQFGRKHDRRAAMDMLVRVEDLPGTGWTLVSQRNSRSIPGPLSSRRPQRFVFALRKFRQLEPARGLHTQLLVFDSETAAREAARRFRTDYLRYPGITTIAERVVDDFTVPGLDSPYLWEKENVRGDVSGFSRSVAGHVGEVAVLVIGSAIGDGWPWEDLITVAGLQASKVRQQTS